MENSHSTLTTRTKCNQKVLNHFAVCISAVIKTRLAKAPDDCLNTVIIPRLDSSENKNSFLDVEKSFFNMWAFMLQNRISFRTIKCCKNQKTAHGALFFFLGFLSGLHGNLWFWNSTPCLTRMPVWIGSLLGLVLRHSGYVLHCY